MSHASSGNRLRVALSVSQRACIHEFPTDLIEFEYGGDVMGKSEDIERYASSALRTYERVHSAAAHVGTQPHLEYLQCCAGAGAR